MLRIAEGGHYVHPRCFNIDFVKTKHPVLPRVQNPTVVKNRDIILEFSWYVQGKLKNANRYIYHQNTLTCDPLRIARFCIILVLRDYIIDLSLMEKNSGTIRFE